MREREAAEFLSVTPRTVRNYRHRGLLPFRQLPGKTCPVMDYDPADLARLKTRLEDRGRSDSKRGAGPTSQARPLPRVSFGLPPEEFGELCAEAGKLNLRPGEYARRLMREAMESRLQADLEELRAHEAKNAGEIAGLRQEVSAAFEAVLEFVGLPPAEAKGWVTENLR